MYMGNQTTELVHMYMGKQPQLVREHIKLIWPKCSSTVIQMKQVKRYGCETKTCHAGRWDRNRPERLVWKTLSVKIRCTESQS